MAEAIGRSSEQKCELPGRALHAMWHRCQRPNRPPCTALHGRSNFICICMHCWTSALPAGMLPVLTPGMWRVTIKPVQDAPCQQTMPISKGQRIRLNHVETSKWLHSHMHRSPLTGNQEVSAYGGPSQSDTGDVWTVSWSGANSLWEKANTVRCYQTRAPGTTPAACVRSSPTQPGLGMLEPWDHNAHHAACRSI